MIDRLSDRSRPIRLAQNASSSQKGFSMISLTALLWPSGKVRSVNFTVSNSKQMTKIILQLGDLAVSDSLPNRVFELSEPEHRVRFVFYLTGKNKSRYGPNA